MTGVPNPKSSGEKKNNRSFVFCTIFVVYLGHGIVHPVAVFLSCLRISFFGGAVLSSRTGELQNKSGALSIVARVPRFWYTWM